MNFSAQFDSPIHGLCWADARGDISTTNHPRWTVTEARDEDGQRVALNPQDEVRAREALDIAWADSLGFEPPAEVDLSFDELPEEHEFEALS